VRFSSQCSYLCWFFLHKIWKERFVRGHGQCQCLNTPVPKRRILGWCQPARRTLFGETAKQAASCQGSWGNSLVADGSNKISFIKADVTWALLDCDRLSESCQFMQQQQQQQQPKPRQRPANFTRCRRRRTLLAAAIRSINPSLHYRRPGKALRHIWDLRETVGLARWTVFSMAIWVLYEL